MKKRFSLKYFYGQAGFTLIEMVAAIVLLGILGLFSTQFITGAAESNRLVSGQKGLVDDAKLAMEFMIRELRVASEDDNEIATTASSITFDKYSGLLIDDDADQIVYSLVGSTVQRQSSNATTTLASGVTAFTVTETPSNSGYFVLTMTLAGSNGENFSLSSGVRPRGSIIK